MSRVFPVRFEGKQLDSILFNDAVVLIDDRFHSLLSLLIARFHLSNTEQSETTNGQMSLLVGIMTLPTHLTHVSDATMASSTCDRGDRLLDYSQAEV